MKLTPEDVQCAQNNHSTLYFPPQFDIHELHLAAIRFAERLVFLIIGETLHVADLADNNVDLSTVPFALGEDTYTISPALEEGEDEQEEGARAKSMSPFKRPSVSPVKRGVRL